MSIRPTANTMVHNGSFFEYWDR